METSHLPPDDRPPGPAPWRIHRGLIWGLALATVVLVIATVVAFRADGGASSSSAPGTVKVGDTLPAITYQAFDGSQATLAADGTPLVVNFWASTCGPCLQEMPAIEQVYREEAGKVHVVGIASVDPLSSAQHMAARTGVTYPLGLDPDGTIVRQLGGIGLPHTVMVAADGKVVYRHTGALTADQLRAAIHSKLGV